MFIKDFLSRNSLSSKVALKQGEKSITYYELNDTTRNISTQLEAYCEDWGNNIGIFLPNSLEYALAYFSITQLDKVIVPIESTSKRREFLSTINYCELRCVLTTSMYVSTISKFLEGIPVKIVLYLVDKQSFFLINQEDELIAYSGNKGIINEESVAIMLHTSGTTSNPKRVMLTHKNLSENIKSNIESLSLTEEDKVLIALPMFFGYCNTAQFLTHLYLGATIVIMESMFFPRTFFQIVSSEKITNFTAVPSMLLMILSYKFRHNYDLSSLRYICFGGGFISADKIKRLMEEFPTVGFVQTYGQTEASPRVTALLPADSQRKCGSVGKPIPNVKVMIVDKDQRQVQLGETGEIIVSGQNVMKGYYKNPEATGRAIKNGWLFTGDLGYSDDEGYIYLLGRKKNIIISGGRNIYPEEIEELIMNYPSILEVCVDGKAHELLGEVPIAKIVKSADAQISEKEILDYCKMNLSSYKLPVKIEFVSDLPKTMTGKIKRFKERLL